MFAIPPNLYAVELSTICNPNQSCEITTSHSEITNNAPFSTGNTNNNKIELKNAHITNFTNTSTIKTYEFSINGSYDDKSYIENFYNYGRIETSNTASLNTATTGENGGYRNIHNYGYISGFVYLSQNESGTTHITNYGEMGGVVQNQIANKEITIDNRGVINLLQEDSNQNKKHFKKLKSLTIKNYAMKVSENAGVFNVFNGNATDNSHLVLDSVGSVKFADSNSKIILDFGKNFEFGTGYAIGKIATDTSGNTYNDLGVNFDRLTTRSELYELTQSGNNFIVNLVKDAKNSAIANLYKSNFKTMNNFYVMSNSMIHPHKFAKKRVVRKKRVIRRVKKVANLFNDSSLQDSTLESHNISSLRELRSDSNQSKLDSPSLSTSGARGWINTIELLELLQSHESFSYKSDSNNLSNSINSLQSLESNESFAYQTPNHHRIANMIQSKQSINQLTNHPRIANTNQTTNFTNQPNRQTNHTQSNHNTNHIRIANTNQTNQTPNRTQSTQRIPNPSSNSTTKNTKSINTTQITQNSNYYFVLTPFVGYNHFFESGRYNLSGLEYGFITAFSGKLNNINALGLHFGFSYGSLKDNDTNKSKGDKEFNITSMNLMLGLNYKLDLIWDSYIKARADVFYFFNQIKSLTIFESLKPNNLGFGVSVAYGKDFNFKQYGVLGLEIGIDYKALNTTSITLSNNGDKSINEVYNKALYNMLYVDLGLNYDKYFNTSIGKWGIDTGLGLKANVTNNVLSTSKVIINNRDNIKMTIDNDLVLAYLNIAGSYLFESKDFDMEFSLAYYGNFGNRTMSNGGGVEWRTTF